MTKRRPTVPGGQGGSNWPFTRLETVFLLVLAVVAVALMNAVGFLYALAIAFVLAGLLGHTLRRLRTKP